MEDNMSIIERLRHSACAAGNPLLTLLLEAAQRIEALETQRNSVTANEAYTLETDEQLRARLTSLVTGAFDGASAEVAQGSALDYLAARYHLSRGRVSNMSLHALCRDAIKDRDDAIKDRDAIREQMKTWQNKARSLSAERDVARQNLERLASDKAEDPRFMGFDAQQWHNKFVEQVQRASALRTDRDNMERYFNAAGEKLKEIRAVLNAD
jgi:hypothetical protein